MINQPTKSRGSFPSFLIRAVFTAGFLASIPLNIPALCTGFGSSASAEAASDQSLSTAVSSTALATGPSGTAKSAGKDGLASQGTGTAGELVTSTTGTEPENTLVDVVHAELSHTIQGTATWMDSFFGDRRYQSELNQSYVRFRYNVFLEEGTAPYLKPDLQVRIVLPQLRDKWHLVFAGTPKETTNFSAVQSGSSEEQQQTTTGDQRAVAAVDRTVLETAQQNFMLRAGAKLHHFKPVVVLGPRYRIQVPLGGWNLRLIEELAWTSNQGWTSRSTVDLEHPLPHNLFFRSTAELVHVEHQIGSDYAVSLVLGQPLSIRRGISYEWVNIFRTEPVNELMETDLRIRYRQRLWRDWLYGEIAPQYRFPRIREFKATPGILFRIEMTLGSYDRPAVHPAVAP